MCRIDARRELRELYERAAIQGEVHHLMAIDDRPDRCIFGLQTHGCRFHLDLVGGRPDDQLEIHAGHLVHRKRERADLHVLKAVGVHR